VSNKLLVITNTTGKQEHRKAGQYKPEGLY